MDVDEWDSAEGRQAFLAAAAPHLRELTEARGSPPPVVKIWHEHPDGIEPAAKEAPDDSRTQA
jgi:hypothetical protein